MHRSEIVDVFGRLVSSVSCEGDANLVASAPDMCTLLGQLDEDKPIPTDTWKEIQNLLKRVHGNRFVRRKLDTEWIQFIEGLLKE
jgi:hypothetical protein